MIEFGKHPELMRQMQTEIVAAFARIEVGKRVAVEFFKKVTVMVAVEDTSVAIREVCTEQIDAIFGDAFGVENKAQVVDDCVSAIVNCCNQCKTAQVA